MGYTFYDYFNDPGAIATGLKIFRSFGAVFLNGLISIGP